MTIKRMTALSEPVTENIHIEILNEQKSAVCRQILKSLPEWFAIPAAIDSYAENMTDLPTLVAKDSHGLIIGFIALKPQTSYALEVYVLGIRRAWHRKGYGRLLFEAAEKMAIDLGATFLTVKTLAGSHPDPYYNATRLFYEAIGFLPIEIFPDLWSPENPCLLMVKALK